ncbi:MAG: Ig-like domain-containing protein [Lachnospiraceae bacterium]|nr:Ig-like domain-containing protein [Lachnospiraceae bacterium]
MKKIRMQLKKTLAIALAALVFVTSIPQSVFAANTSELEEAVYDDGAESALTYSDLIPLKTDSAEKVASKLVTFNGKKWYIIEDNSKSENKGTITLFAEGSFANSKYNEVSESFYAGSTIERYLNNLLGQGGSFASVAHVISGTDLADVNVSGAKLYILDSVTAGKLPPSVRKDGNTQYVWWTRTPFGNYVVTVNASTGEIMAMGGSPILNMGVRPALRLNLASVTFSSETKTFKAKEPSNVTKAPEPKTLYYNEGPQELVTAGEATGGTLYYAVTERGVSPTDDLYSTSIPVGTEVGSYDVYYMVKGDSEHADTEPAKVEVEILKRLYTGVKSVQSYVFNNTGTFAFCLLPELPFGAAYPDFTKCTTASGKNDFVSVTGLQMAEGNLFPERYQGSMVLIYTAVMKPAGTTDTIIIPVTGAKDYADFDVLVTVTALNKGEAGVSISGNDGPVTYGDEGFTLTGAVDNAGEGGVWTWESEDTSVAEINANTGAVTVKGAGMTAIKAKYESDTTIGETSVTLVVEKKELDIAWSDNAFTYDGEAHKPTATITDGVINEDACEVSVVGEKVNAGTGYVAQAKLSGKNAGNYKIPADKASCSFDISRASMSEAVVTLGEALIYNGAEQTQTVSKVELGSLDITDQCEITGNKATEAGDYSLTVSGREDGNYFGSVSKAYSISKKNITPTIKVEGSYSYTGNPITPRFTVRDEDRPLTEGTDYTVTYKDNVYPGPGKIEIVPNGNYTFEPVTETFTIAKADASRVISLKNLDLETFYKDETVKTTIVNPYPEDSGEFSFSLGTDYEINGNDESTTKITEVSLDEETGEVTISFKNGTPKDRILIPITFSSENYADYTSDISVFLLERKLTTITADSSVEKTYGDADFYINASVPKEAGIGTWKWSIDDTSVATIGDDGKVSIKNVGTAAITVTFESETMTAKKQISLSVGKKTVYIRDTVISDKVYNGTPFALVKDIGTLEGVLEGDDVYPVSGSASFSNVTVGEWDVRLTGCYISGEDVDKYKLAYRDFTVKGKITPKELYASIQAMSRAYERGNNKVELNLISLEGDIISLDKVSVDESSLYGIMEDANAGKKKAVTVSEIRLEGPDALNYTVDYTSALTVDINKANPGMGSETFIAMGYLYPNETTDSLDLADYLPEDAGTFSYTVSEITGDITFKEEPAISGSVLSYTVNPGTGNEESIITITASSQNYEDIMFRVRISLEKLALYEKTGKSKYEECPVKNLNSGKSTTLVPMFVDGTVVNKRVVWASLNPNIATVTQDGKVTGLSSGTTTILVKSEENPNLTAKCIITVREPVTAITLDKTAYSFGSGESVTISASVLPFTAMSRLDWSTDNNNVSIEVSEDTLSAVITGVNAGKATVTAVAHDGSGKKATCKFTIGNPVPDFTVTGKNGAAILAAGKTLTMQVNWGGKSLTPANTGVTWSVVKAEDGSDASDIASISSKGVLKGLSEGTVRVVVTSKANPTVIKESEPITIYVPVKSASLNKTTGSVSLADGSNGLQLTVNVTSAVSGKAVTGETLGSAHSVTWSVDPKYADNLSVSDTGLVTAGTGEGKNIPVVATVKAFNGYEKKLTCKVTVIKASPLKGIKISKSKLSIGENNKTTLTATLNPVNPDGDNGFYWESSDDLIVKVDRDTGEIIGFHCGTAKITVTAKGTVTSKGKTFHPSAICTVTVTPSVNTIKFTNAEALKYNGLNKGKTYALKTKLSYTGRGKAATSGLIWTSSDERIATVSSKGVVKAISPGEVTIKAQSSDVKTAGEGTYETVSFTVHSAVTKISIDKKKLILGTQKDSEFGKINVASVQPADVTDPSIKWTTDKKDVVTLFVIPKYADPSTSYKHSGGESVITGSGEALGIKSIYPGVVKLTGTTTDGSKKKVTCTVTVRGYVNNLQIKEVTTKSGIGEVKLLNGAHYESILNPGGKLTVTPVRYINSYPEYDTSIKKKLDYLRSLTDKTIAFRSSDTSIATVDRKGKVTVNKNAPSGSVVTIIAAIPDGTYECDIRIIIMSKDDFANSEHSIDVSDAIENGSIFISGKTARTGQKILVSLMPEENYKYVTDSLKVKLKDGTEVPLNIHSEGVEYDFIMPDGDVTITADFVKK